MYLRADDSKRLTWLDLARGFGIIFMYAGHMPNLFPQIFRDWIFSFHMPLFYIISGFLYKIRSPGELLKRSTRLLLLPYVIYSVVFIVLDAMLYQNSGMQRDSILGLLTGQGGHGVLWFFFSLFLVENIFNLLLFLLRKKSQILQIGVVGIASLIGYLMTLFGIATLFKLSVSIGAMMFFGTGVLVRRYHLMEKQGVLLSAICGGVALILFVIMKMMCFPMIDINGSEMGFLPLSFPCAVCGSMLIMTLSHRLDGRWVLPIRYIGRNSLYFYPLGTYIPVRIMECGIRFWRVSATTSWNLLSKVLGYTMTVGVTEFCKLLNEKRKNHSNLGEKPRAEK